jgi:hypothetical protein
MSATQSKQLQHDHQARHVPRKRIAKTRAVREDEVSLKLGQPIVGNAGIRQQSEASVDAIDGLAASDDAVHGRSSVGNTLERCIVEPGIRTCPQFPQVV